MPALRTHDGPYTIHSYAASFGLDYWLLPVDGASHRDDGPMQATTKLFVSVTLSHKLLSIPVMAQDLSLSTTNCLFQSPALADSHYQSWINCVQLISAVYVLSATWFPARAGAAPKIARNYCPDPTQHQKSQLAKFQLGLSNHSNAGVRVRILKHQMQFK